VLCWRRPSGRRARSTEYPSATAAHTERVWRALRAGRTGSHRVGRTMTERLRLGRRGSRRAAGKGGADWFAGSTYSLAATRYPGLDAGSSRATPLPGPQLRTPRYTRHRRARPWGPSTTQASDTWPIRNGDLALRGHLDALAHMTVGKTCTGTAAARPTNNLTIRPTFGDASRCLRSSLAASSSMPPATRLGLSAQGLARRADEMARCARPRA